MSESVKNLLAEVGSLSLSDALELRQAIEQRIAVLALKTLSAETLEAIDSAEGLSDAISLQSKSEML